MQYIKLPTYGNAIKRKTSIIIDVETKDFP